MHKQAAKKPGCSSRLGIIIIPRTCITNATKRPIGFPAKSYIRAQVRGCLKYLKKNKILYKANHPELSRTGLLGMSKKQKCTCDNNPSKLGQDFMLTHRSIISAVKGTQWRCTSMVFAA